ncbi:FadR/GntR family transcriptional regulator [Agrobacterium arsenijevicii]|uniref:FadR/GntR family transcriptional regulator n=1 Tax=Agrobacterium arsenijevicii TaxID=1585697 RepID=UPI0005D381D4
MTLSPSRPRHSPGVSLYASLLSQIGQRIVRGELAPGTLLPNVEALSAAHGVSRTVMREVMKVLAGKGMVESRPRTGTRIRPRADWNFLDSDVLTWRYSAAVYPDDVRALFELRRGIEPLAGALAAKRATAAEVAELKRYYAQMEEHADDGERFSEPDLAFHQLILRMTGNELIGSLASLIEAALIMSFRLSNANPLGQRPSLPLHRQVVDCIETGDSEGAQSALLILLDGAEADVLRAISG